MRLLSTLAAGALALVVAGAARSQAVATYEFQNTYAADQSGKPALNSYAPGTGTLAFITDTVSVGSQSLTRTVLDRGGAVAAAQANQAGVQLTTTSLLTNPNVYSVDMVLSMTTLASYERVLNTNDGIDGGL
jgi:hypothetical protein